MKQYRIRFLSLLLVFVMAFACLGETVSAADNSYQITVYAGNQGYFTGACYASVIRGGTNVAVPQSVSADRWVISGLQYGDRVSLTPGVQVTNGKYYARGLRQSGRDNDTVSTASFVVTRDEICVVAYGILGNMTTYTVNYVDQNGAVVHAPNTCEGNVGDKIIEPYIYIEGYTPNAYNLSHTLQADASKNVFTFRYTKIVTPTPAPAGDNTGNNTGTNTGTGTTGGTGTNNAGGTDLTGGNGTDTNNAGGMGTAGENGVPAGDIGGSSSGSGSGSGSDAAESGNGQTSHDEGSSEPAEIIDLDEDNVAMSGGSAFEGDAGSSELWKWIGGGLLLGILIALVLRLFSRRRKKQG